MADQNLLTPEQQKAAIEAFKNGPGIPAAYVYALVGGLVAIMGTLAGLVLKGFKRGERRQEKSHSDAIEALKTAHLASITNYDKRLSEIQEARNQSTLDFRERIKHLETLVNMLNEKLTEQHRERLEEAVKQAAEIAEYTAALEGVTSSNNEVADGTRGMHTDLREVQKSISSIQLGVMELLGRYPRSQGK